MTLEQMIGWAKWYRGIEGDRPKNLPTMDQLARAILEANAIIVNYNEALVTAEQERDETRAEIERMDAKCERVAEEYGQLKDQLTAKEIEAAGMRGAINACIEALEVLQGHTVKGSPLWNNYLEKALSTPGAGEKALDALKELSERGCDNQYKFCTEDSYLGDGSWCAACSARSALASLGVGVKS